MVLLPHAAFSDEWPNCKFQCQADDVIISKLWLGDDSGKELSACIPAEGQKAYLWVEFSNNVDSPRYAVIFLADLYLNGVLSRSFYDEGQCVTDLLPPRSTHAFSLYRFMWNCGDEVLLKRLVLSWETAKGSGCGDGGRKCGNRNSQCYGNSGDRLSGKDSSGPKLSLRFDGVLRRFPLLLRPNCGGLKPYLHYWDYGDALTAASRIRLIDMQNLATMLTLFITDKSQKKASMSNSLVIQHPAMRMRHKWFVNGLREDK